MKTFRGILRRLLRRLPALSPVRALENWAYQDWHEHGSPTWRSRLYHAVAWKVSVLHALVRALCSRSSDEFMGIAWWQRALYRAKASICLLLGWHHQGETPGYLVGVEVAWWNGRMSGYYEPEWEDDNLHVGEGWRNWWVRLQ